MTVTEARRQELLDAQITLNGERAYLSGVAKPFARVTQARTGLGCEFCWETVEHVITNRSGAFTS